MGVAARAALAVVAVAMGLAFGVQAALAAVFTVDSTADGADMSPGDGVCRTFTATCTIRAGLQEANALAGADEVRVPPGVYSILGAGLPVDSNVRLVGAGGSRRTKLLAAPTAHVVLDIGGSSNTATVEGFEITGLTGSGPTVEVDGPKATLRDLWVHDNDTDSMTGGVAIHAGEVTIAQSSITANRLTRGDTAIGGGIHVDGGAVTVETTTIAGNLAHSTLPDSTAHGGGVGVTGGNVALRHVTLQADSSMAYGGNIFTNAVLEMSDSIVVDGVGAVGPNCFRGGPGAFTAAGRNVRPGAMAGDNCEFPTGTVASATTPLLPLGDRGGTGLSLVPTLPGAAVDGAASCPVGGRDQRGAPAPAGAACDIGATELGADLGVAVKPAGTTAAAGSPTVFVVTTTNSGLDAAPATRLSLALSPSQPVTTVTPSRGSCTATSCDLGALEPGQSATAVVIAPLRATARCV